MRSSLQAPAESTARRLWKDNQDLAQAALAHRFVRGLADGTLPRPVFQTYVAQDAYFLDAFVRAYALALARCPDQDGLRSFFDLLAGALDELKLHAGYAARLGIDLAASRPSISTPRRPPLTGQTARAFAPMSAGCTTSATRPTVASAASSRTAIRRIR